MKSPTRRSAAARQMTVEESQAPAQTLPNNSLLDILKPVLVIAILGGLGYLAYSIYEGRGVAERSSATGQLFFATQFDDPERYRIVESEYGQTKAGIAAALLRADSDLSQAIDSLYISRESETEELLESAIKTYRRVIEKSGSDAFLGVRARYGLAQALETSGEIDEAIELYEKLGADTNASEAIQTISKDRAANLKKPETKAFYEWFAKTAPATPATQTPIAPPSVDNLPSEPDMKVTDLPKTPEPPVTPPVAEKPAPPAEKDAAEMKEKPAEPAAEKPADKPEEKPADKPEDKPEDKPADNLRTNRLRSQRNLKTSLKRNQRTNLKRNQRTNLKRNPRTNLKRNPRISLKRNPQINLSSPSFRR